MRFNGSIVGKTHNTLTDSIADTVRYLGGDVYNSLGTTSPISIDISDNVGLQSGDLIIVAASIGSSGVDRTSIMTPTGFTTVASVFADDSTDTSLVASYKVAADSTDGVILFESGTGSGTDGIVICVHVWRGVNTSGTILDVSPTTASIINSGIPVPSSITPVTSGSVVLIAMATGHASGVDTYTAMSGTSYLFSDGVNETYDITGGLAAYFWVSGSYTPPSPTFSAPDSTSYSAASITFALRPGTIPSIQYNAYKKTGIWDSEAAYLSELTN